MKNVLVWLALLAVGYFGADIVEKGQALNALTPWPVLGWLLWGLTVFFVWHWLVSPIIQFCMLERADSVSDVGRARAARRYLKSLPRRDADEEKALARLDTALTRRDPEWVRDALVEFGAVDKRRKAAGELIMKHSKIAGVAVVFSRNNMLDGIMMFVVQMRLVVELARLAGYKPSPVFNSLCFVWVLTNSLLNALFAQDSAHEVGDLFAGTVGELLFTPEELGADAVGSFACAFTISTLLEALIAGTTVYVTGHIFLRRLHLAPPADSGGSRLKELADLRRQGRKELGLELLKSVPEFAGSAVKCVGGMVWDAVGYGFTSSKRKEPDTVS